MSEERDLKRLIADMTLEEKAGLCSGRDFWHTKAVERLGVPAIMLTDGPHGLRKQSSSPDHLGISDSVPATCYPSAAGLASSWDRKLIRRIGAALGDECKTEGVGVLLGPGANIKRSPLCGRNFEYFSEDPCLSSEMAAAHIEGVQSQGVGASLKHFAVNNQEHRRMTVDAVVDPRALREIYLASFEGAVKKGKPWTVMCSYNRVNGEYASESKALLTDILREEWGFGGIVVSDWGAVNERDAALAAGLELEMPASGGAGDQKIVAAVRSGKLSEAALDDAVERLLSMIFKAADAQRSDGAACDMDAHHALAREAAAESMVLLKNKANLLPLRKGGRLALIGELAVRPRFQGGGSSHVNPSRLDDVREELARSAGPDARIVYKQGYALDSDESDDRLIAEACEAAAVAETAVIVSGLPERYESEGYDRTHLRLPDNQVRLIEAVARVQPRTVVVLCNGAPVEMPWLDRIGALLEAYLGGQALGGALADLLFGDANPCGKLAETFPHRLEHNPSYPFFPGEGNRVEYREGVFVGYRYYDTKCIEPLFPFGFGLSYTTFAYSDLRLNRTELEPDGTVEASVRLANTGSRAGKEIVQLYVAPVSPAVIRPVQELRRFCKVELQPGESRTVTFELDRRAFAYYDPRYAGWRVDPGAYDIRIGSSSRHPKAERRVTVPGEVLTWHGPNRRYDRNTTLGELLADARTAALAKQLLARLPFAASAFADPAEEGGMMTAFLNDLPLRGLVAFGSGAFTEQMLEKTLAELNRHTPE